MAIPDRLSPFSRCLRCGGELAPVTKAEAADRLEPLTRLYVDDFRRCRACGEVYWCGSHHERLNRIVDEIPAGI